MCRFKLFWVLALFTAAAASGQVLKEADPGILVHGAVFDAATLRALPGSQIIINRTISALSDEEGKFVFNFSRGDTMIVTRMGYKPALFTISDTLAGREFVAGIYMHTDTLEIEEVVIIPRYSNLRRDIFTSRPESDVAVENARYNLEVSSYQGRVGVSRLGDPAMNYEVLRQQHRNDAYSKGQIPSDRIAGISPFMLIPAAYLLMNGLPEKPPAIKPQLNEKEVEVIHGKYLESIRKR